MKPTRLLVAFAGLFCVLPIFAQSTITNETTRQAPVTTVETRTIVEGDGSAVTERVTTRIERERTATTQVYTAAVVVSNRAGSTYDDQIAVVEDVLSARLADLGFQLISRELVTSSLRNFTPAATQTTADATTPNASTSAEAAFLDQSSALRLAQNLGADYLLHASITSYGTFTRTAPSYSGNSQTFNDHTLRIAYKVLDAQGGAALTGGDAKASRSLRGASATESNTQSVLADLIDETTAQITASMRTRIASGRIAAARPAANQVTITVNLEAADLYIPDVRISAENVVTVGESKFKVTPLNATVEVDGVAVGSAPGPLTLKPGFSRLRITREGFTPWERVISASNGQVLNIALTMSADGLKRFRESTEFVNDLKNGAKLTDAEVKVLEGKAKSLENSFFKVDTQENFRFILPERYRELPLSQQDGTASSSR